MILILALLAVTPSPLPPAPSAYVGPELRDEGVRLGTVNVLDCRGSGITCSRDGGVGTITVASSADGGSIAIPACAAGYVLDGDGGALYCINVIATASALAANPADCASNQYATAIAASGDLTCSQVTTAQLSGTVTNAQLASLYSGVGACGSHLFASTLVSNSSPTCTQPAFTDLSGTPLAGGSVPQVQYNADGGLAGIANLTSDGTNPIVIGINTHPASPLANVTHYDFQPLPSFPGFPFVRDNFMGTPIPLGVLGAFSGGLGFSSWTWQCTRKPSAGTLITVYGNPPTASNWASTPGQALATTTLVSRIPWLTGSTTLGFQASALIQDNPTTLSGNAFIWWARINMSATSTRAAWFFGMSSSSAVFTTAPPSTLLGTIYFGCDGNGGGTQANLHICSNDDTGTATCTDLGSGFPCRSNDTIYDLWLASAPGYALPDGGLGASYYVANLDAGTSAAGTTSNDLPDSGQGMRWYLEGNQGDAGSPNIITAGFNTSCLANSL